MCCFSGRLLGRRPGRWLSGALQMCHGQQALGAHAAGACFSKKQASRVLLGACDDPDGGSNEYPGASDFGHRLRSEMTSAHDVFARFRSVSDGFGPEMTAQPGM